MAEMTKSEMAERINRKLAGWVQSQADEGARGRKRSYAVLPAGREELVRWMAESSEPRNLRDEMMVRLRAAALLGPNGLAEDLRARLCSHQQQLELYKTIETRDFLGREGSQALKLQHLILQAGIQYEEMYVKFCADALNLLEAGVT